MTRPVTTPASAGTTDLREALETLISAFEVSDDGTVSVAPGRILSVALMNARGVMEDTRVGPLSEEIATLRERAEAAETRATAAESRPATLAAKNEALRKVVKPFAKLADNNRIMTNFGRDITTTPDGWLACGLEIPVDCLRAARDALTPGGTHDPA